MMFTRNDRIQRVDDKISIQNRGRAIRLGVTRLREKYHGRRCTRGFAYHSHQQTITNPHLLTRIKIESDQPYSQYLNTASQIHSPQASPKDQQTGFHSNFRIRSRLGAFMNAARKCQQFSLPAARRSPI